MNDKYPVPHEQVAARVVEEQAVIVLADSGEVNVLNEVGTRIWQMIDGTRTVAQIANALATEFDVAPEVALADTCAFVQRLLEARAVELKDAPPL